MGGAREFCDKYDAAYGQIRRAEVMDLCRLSEGQGKDLLKRVQSNGLLKLEGAGRGLLPGGAGGLKTDGNGWKRMKLACAASNSRKGVVDGAGARRRASCMTTCWPGAQLRADRFHRHTIKESDADGATVPVLHEGRPPRARSRTTPAIKQKYATKGHILDAPALIANKARDMLRHYVAKSCPMATRPRSSPTAGWRRSDTSRR